MPNLVVSLYANMNFDSCLDGVDAVAAQIIQ